MVVYGPMAMDEDGVLVNLRFAAVGKTGSISPLALERTPVLTLVEREGRVKTHHMEHVASTNIKRIFARECFKRERFPYER